MKNEVDWSAISSELKEAVEESNSCFPAVEKMLLEDEERRQRSIRAKRQHALATVLALFAILVSILVGWEEITDILNQVQKALSP